MVCCACVQSVRSMLENPTEAVNELSYFDCIDSVMENSKVEHLLLLPLKLVLSLFCCLNLVEHVLQVVYMFNLLNI